MLDNRSFTENRLMANLAHSIRNPLSSIKMRLYSLGRLDLPDAQEDDLAVIGEEISSIEALVRNVLKYSKHLEITPKSASPSDVMDKTLHMLAPDFKKQEVRLDLYRDQRLSDIMVDAERLKEVYANLIINGMEAGGNADRRIFINEKEVRQSNAGHCAVIEVCDNGCGMPDFIKQRLFEPFFTTKADGTGLGLCIANQIVEAHGGTLTFSTRENKGSVFTIMLPYYQEHKRAAS